MICKAFSRAFIPMVLRPTLRSMAIKRPVFMFTSTKSVRIKFWSLKIQEDGTHPDFQVKTKAPAVKKTSEEI